MLAKVSASMGISRNWSSTPTTTGLGSLLIRRKSADDKVSPITNITSASRGTIPDSRFEKASLKINAIRERRIAQIGNKLLNNFMTAILEISEANYPDYW